MSLKPEIITMEIVAAEMPGLESRKKELTLLRDEALNRFKTIEKVVNENKAFEGKSKEQVDESVSLLLEEWIKMREYYPEVRLAMLQKISAFVAPAAEEPKKP